MRDVEEYVKQLENENMKLREKLEERNSPSYARQLCVSHSAASYYISQIDNAEDNIMEKMSRQLAKEISKPEYTQVDTFKEQYSGNIIYRMRCHIVPT